MARTREERERTVISAGLGGRGVTTADIRGGTLGRRPPQAEPRQSPSPLGLQPHDRLQAQFLQQVRLTGPQFAQATQALRRSQPGLPLTEARNRIFLAQMLRDAQIRARGGGLSDQDQVRLLELLRSTTGGGLPAAVPLRALPRGF